MDIFGDIHVYGNNSKIHLNSTPTQANPYNGFITHDDADPNLVFGDVVYYDLEENIWKKSCGNDVKTLPARGIAVTNYDTDKKEITILLHGFIYNFNYTQITKSQLWLSSKTPGALTDIIPNEIGMYCQTIGIAKTTNIFYLDFCPFYIQLG